MEHFQLRNSAACQLLADLLPVPTQALGRLEVSPGPDPSPRHVPIFVCKSQGPIRHHLGDKGKLDRLQRTVEFTGAPGIRGSWVVGPSGWCLARTQLGLQL